jgi:hypothetical protein
VAPWSPVIPVKVDPWEGGGDTLPLHENIRGPEYYH